MTRTTNDWSNEGWKERRGCRTCSSSKHMENLQPWIDSSRLSRIRAKPHQFTQPVRCTRSPPLHSETWMRAHQQVRPVPVLFPRPLRFLRIHCAVPTSIYPSYWWRIKWWVSTQINGSWMMNRPSPEHDLSLWREKRRTETRLRSSKARPLCSSTSPGMWPGQLIRIAFVLQF
jgi:hypothetical protein